MPGYILEFRSRFSAGKSVVLQPAFAAGQLLAAQQQGQMELSVQLGDIGAPIGPSVVARVNAAYLGGRFGWKGRWIADCDEDCSGAEMIDWKTPVFMCCACFNRAVGFQWRTIILPENRVGIERALLRRPKANIHNFEPGETLADLIEQNHMLGIEPGRVR